MLNSLLVGIGNLKTTAVAVLLFLIVILPDLIQVLTNFNAVLVKAQEVIQTGDFMAIWVLKPLIGTLVGSVVLLFSRNWHTAGDES